MSEYSVPHFLKVCAARDKENYLDVVGCHCILKIAQSLFQVSL